MEQKAGNVNWQEVNSLVRPGVLRMFTYQLVSRGAEAVLYFRWRQPRFGSEQYHGAVLPHAAHEDGRVYNEISQIGEELKLLAPAIKDTQVKPEVCILYSHENEWSLQYPLQPNKYFSLREHIQLFYNALHDRNILVDFARPCRRPLGLPTGDRPLDAPAVGRRGGSAQALCPERRHPGQHVQHRPRGRQSHGAR